MSGRFATVLESSRAASGLLRAGRSSDNQPAGSGPHRGCGRPDRRPAPGAGLCHGRIAGQNSYRTVYSFPGCATALLPTPTMLNPRTVRQQRADIDAVYELVERVDQKVDALDVMLDRLLDEISGQLSEVLRQLGGR